MRAELRNSRDDVLLYNLRLPNVDRERFPNIDHPEIIEWDGRYFIRAGEKVPRDGELQVLYKEVYIYHVNSAIWD